jgi:hypothetical protein
VETPHKLQTKKTNKTIKQNYYIFNRHANIQITYYEIVILYSRCKYNARNSLNQYVTTVDHLRFALILIIASVLALLLL